ncbi:2-succinyl-5-enolpyruvyl-6-hydroxy-3-cyclohexene-1-carboxylic-acid synthase [Brochothrix campestris]|uniref:2-succinyl-5-enolpyruvyl-6-hydroxy-3- cyclohexene-1-carboxylic-acid synthase n=1 Tax=Brochothrix campestris TaxID=2757 RepID=UPI0038D0023D
MTKHQIEMTQYLAAFIEEIVQAGVKEAVISPGSRSTPLAMLMAEHPTLKIYIDIDERSAGFFALGLAKASLRPVVLLCTSGTAAANYMPAVVEANLSNIPLVVLTSDRPHELRGVGAPQAIDQIHLYGHHVKEFVEMALPEASAELLNYAKWQGARAVDIALKAPRGPVHLNFPLRQPLMPLLEPSPFSGEQKRHHVHIYSTNETVSSELLAEMLTLCHGKKGLIVMGDLQVAPALAAQIVQLSHQLGFPVLADPLSQLRSFGQNEYQVIDQYDSLFRFASVKEQVRAEVIIRMGAMPVSKFLSQYLETLVDARHIIIDPGSMWRDPIKAATDMVHCDETVFVEGLLASVDQAQRDSEWYDQWQRLNRLSKTCMNQYLAAIETLDEGKVVAQLQQHLPNEAALYVGNSMPIRDIDTFFIQTNKQVRIVANRGANGIDGNISTALGMSVTQQPMYALMGDVTFYHDMNGLLMARTHQLNLTLIVINNNGGGIFSFLPQSESPRHFEQLFGTPTDISIEKAANLYDATYHAVQDWEDFQDTLDRAEHHKGLNIIEVKTNRYENVVTHRSVWDNIKAVIDHELL